MDRLQELVHGHFVQIRLSKQTRERRFKESVERMNQERAQREARRLGDMNRFDKFEDEGKIVIRPYKGNG